VTRRVPRTVDTGQVAAILAACERVRDRFLFALLAGTGIFSAGHPLRRKLISAFAQLRG
jgi:hypothetical protein